MTVIERDGRYVWQCCHCLQEGRGATSARRAEVNGRTHERTHQ